MPTCLLITKYFPFWWPTEDNVLKVDAPGPDRRGWKRSHSEIDPNHLPAGWKKRVADGANFVLQETWAPHTKLHRPSRVVFFAFRRFCRSRQTTRTMTQRFGLLRIHTEPEVCIARSARDRRTIMQGTGPSACNLGSGRQLFGFSGSWTVS